MFFISAIIASELVVLNCLYKEENICHWQSMCRETVLKISLSLREAFSNLVAFTVINKYGKVGVVQISTVFGPLTMLLVKGFSETRPFRLLSNNIFRCP